MVVDKIQLTTGIPLFVEFFQQEMEEFTLCQIFYLIEKKKLHALKYIANSGLFFCLGEKKSTNYHIGIVQVQQQNSKITIITYCLYYSYNNKTN